MGIMNTQYGRKKDQVVQDFLKKGYHPTSYDVSSELEVFFKNYPLGMPHFLPIEQPLGEQSNAKLHNTMFGNLGEDIQALYDSVIGMSNKFTAVEEIYEHEISKNNALLREVGQRIEHIKRVLSKKTVAESYYETFRDLLNTEMTSNEDRNIVRTDAFIDLEQGAVINPKISYASNKYPISNSKVSIKPSPGNAIEMNLIGNTSSVLNDILNDFVLVQVNGKHDVATSIVITMELEVPVATNLVSILTVGNKYMTCELETSEDGVNFTGSYTVTSNKLIEWNFNERIVKTLKITMTQSECHRYFDGNYEFYYTIRNISVYNETYKTNSSIISKPITFQEPVSVFTIHAQEHTPQNTAISYFVGVDNGREKITWQALQNKQPYEINIVDKHVEMPSVTGIADGISHISKLKDNYNQNSIQLYPGYQMWSVREYDYSAETPIADFNFNTRPLSECFVDSDKYTHEINTGQLYVYTQYVMSTKDCIYTNKFICLTGPEALTDSIQSNLSVVFMINNSEVQGNAGLYSFNLKKGTNKIQIAVTCKPDIGTTATLFNDVNFKDNNFDVFAYRKMSPVSIYSLNAKTPMNAFTKFSIDADGNIITKLNDQVPTDAHDLNGIRFYLKYNTVKKDKLRLLAPENNKYVLQVRVLAVLSSNDKALTPKLYGYALTGE